MNDYDAKFYKVIGRQLRDARKSKGLTLEQVGKELDLIAKTIQRYEMGDRKIAINRMKAMAELYGVDYRQLINDAESELAIEGDFYDSEEPSYLDRPALRKLISTAHKLTDEQLDALNKLIEALV